MDIAKAAAMLISKIIETFNSTNMIAEIKKNYNTDFYNCKNIYKKYFC